MLSETTPMEARWREMVEQIEALHLTPEQWGAALLAALREGSLEGAVALIHLAPRPVGGLLSAALCAAGPTILKPANEP